MPFYEYQCRACGAHHEVLQKISDPPLRKCPSCGQFKLQKLVSAPVFRLKGGGWYETDFKSDQETRRNLVGDDKGQSSDSPSESKSESKPDAKPDAKPEAKADSKPAVKAPKAKPTRAPARPAARKAAAKPAKKAARRR
ncbi:MAG: zinc ribbon domain-containing protein [Steroidobacteraceae bacterium]|nr:zinc ribbon domain-containing protein [Steroidobacteraceae bacterium]